MTIESSISPDLTLRIATVQGIPQGILSGNWKDLDRVMVGSRIEAKNAGGRATVNEMALDSSRAYLTINEAFTSTTLNPGEWVVKPRVPKPLFNKNRQAPYLFDTRVFNSIYSIMEDVTNTEFHDSIDRLGASRDPLNIGDSEIRQLLDTLGSTIDTSALTRSQQRVLIHELIEFYNVSGTSGYIGFIRFVLGQGSSFVVDKLYTRDYETFVSDMLPGYYATNRLRVSTQPGFETNRFNQLFNDLSPATDLIHEIAVSVEEETAEVFVSAAAATVIYM